MNYKLVIQYDGSNYSGWQIQANSVSVQEKITDSINTILDTKVNLIGSGRTDTGVHAIAQAANFRYDGEINIYRFRHSLNSILPFDIAVTSMTAVPEEFHARFDAKKRSYIYLLTRTKTPLLHDYSYHYHNNLDLDSLNKLSALFIGKHDFRSFAKKSEDIENTFCTIYSARWRTVKGVTIFFIEADRYLHGMVRTIVGTLLTLSYKGTETERVTEILNGKNRTLAGEAVPAKGLYLYKVKY